MDHNYGSYSVTDCNDNLIWQEEDEPCSGYSKENNLLTQTHGVKTVHVTERRWIFQETGPASCHY